MSFVLAYLFVHYVIFLSVVMRMHAYKTYEYIWKLANYRVRSAV